MLGKETTTNELDVLGIAFNAFVMFVAAFAHTLPFVPVMTNLDLDPIKHFIDADVPFLQTFILQRKYMKHLIPIARVVLQGIAVLAICRLVALLLPSIAISAKAFQTIIQWLLCHSKQMTSLRLTEFSRLHLLYCRLTLIMRLSEPLNGTCILLLMIGGFVLWVGCSFIAVRMYSTLPMGIYAFVIGALIIVQVAANVLLPQAIQIFEDGKEVLEIWKLKLAYNRGFGIKLRSRKLKALRPFRIYATLGDYTVFYLQRSTLITYYDLCLTNSVNTLLTL
jgi:hypothetical protein